MNDIIHSGFIAMAKRIAEGVSKETQTDAVIVIIAHSSGERIAVGFCHDADTETPSSVKAIIEQAGKEFAP